MKGVTSYLRASIVKLKLYFWGLQGNAGTNPNIDFIGTNDTQLIFSVRTANKLRSLWYGSAFIVGPSSQLQEVLTALPSIQQGINSLNNFSNVYVHSNTTQSAGFRTIRRGGTITTPTLPPANAILSFFNSQAFNGTTDVNVQTCISRIVGAPTATSIPTSYTIATTPAGSTTPLDRFFIAPNGNTGIGNYTGVSQPLSLLESQGSFGANIRSVNASTTLLDTDYTVVFNGVGLTATLPTPVNKRIYNIKNASTGILNIKGNIDGVVQTIVITGGNSRTFHSNGVTWFLI